MAREEAARVEAICDKFATNAKSLRSQKACDERGAELKQVFAELPEADQNHAEIKLAFTKAINAFPIPSKAPMFHVKHRGMRYSTP